MERQFQGPAVIGYPIALDDMQSGGVWRAEAIDYRFVVHADGVDHQRVAFVMADGIPVIGQLTRRMRLVEIDGAGLVVALIQKHDAVGSLQHLHGSDERKHVGHAGGPASRGIG